MADNVNLIDALQALAHERKIDEFYIIEKLEESLAKSYEKILGLVNPARVTIDRKSGRMTTRKLTSRQTMLVALLLKMLKVLSQGLFVMRQDRQFTKSFPKGLAT